MSRILQLDTQIIGPSCQSLCVYQYAQPTRGKVYTLAVFLPETQWLEAVTVALLSDTREFLSFLVPSVTRSIPNSQVITDFVSSEACQVCLMVPQESSARFLCCQFKLVEVDSPQQQTLHFVNVKIEP